MCWISFWNWIFFITHNFHRKQSPLTHKLAGWGRLLIDWFTVWHLSDQWLSDSWLYILTSSCVFDTLQAQSLWNITHFRQSLWSKSTLWRPYPSDYLSVTWCQWLNCLLDFHEIWYRVLYNMLNQYAFCEVWVNNSHTLLEDMQWGMLEWT